MHSPARQPIVLTLGVIAAAGALAGGGGDRIEVTDGLQAIETAGGRARVQQADVASVADVAALVDQTVADLARAIDRAAR